MKRRISFRPYSRDFLRPLATARGQWAVREGFIVRVEEGDRVGYGEVAPIPEFGTESVEDARRFLEAVSANPELKAPTELYCCEFGLSAALVELSDSREYEVAALLPAGGAALAAAEQKLDCGFRTLKWKVGVEAFSEEKAVFNDLIQSLPDDSKLRLDANCGLNAIELERWLEMLSADSNKIEFLEQPLPVGGEELMAKLSAAFAIPIALDESLNGSYGGHWFEAGAWDGPLVVKGLLMGNAAQLVDRLRLHADRIVWSSVFETAVGLTNALAIIGALPQSQYAIGFDTLGAFDDGLNLAESMPILSSEKIGARNLEQLWKNLPHSN